ncbi:MAG: HEPN domain-containing protein [bacterium]
MKRKEIEKLMEKSESNYRSAKMNYDQEFYDAALSRAYYSMFYLAEAILLTKDLRFSKHSGVISAFGQHFAATGEVDPKLHRLLIEAGKERNEGDYDYMVEISEREVGDVLKIAKEFNDEIIAYLKVYLLKGNT